MLEIIHKRKEKLNIKSDKEEELVLIDKKMTDSYTKTEWYIILKNSVETNSDQIEELKETNIELQQT